MILDKELKLKVNPAQIKHFTSIGLDVKVGEIINIKPEQLNVGSNIEINCECDVCGKQKINSYRRYVRSVGNSGYYSCSPKCAQEKVKKTFLEKYGEEHHFKSVQSKEKIKKTWLKKYGEKHFSHSETYRNNVNDIQEKRRITLENKYVESESLISIENDCFIKYCEQHDGEYQIERRLYHNRKRSNIDTCTICYPLNENTSIKEKELHHFITKNYGDEIIPNYRMGNTEIDVFIPSLMVGFEFNGLHWHNENYRNNTYHLDKTEFFESKGIKLIHVYEDDWDIKRPIVESRILNILGKSEIVYARKCELKEITPKESRRFMEINHIQGNVNAKIKIGLFHNNEMVSVMTFGKKRKSLGSTHKEGELELLRFCNKLNTSVVGGASKLFKFFIKKYKPNNVISYADRSWSDGNLYRVLGFGLSHKTKPNYYYIINKIRYNRYNFRKDKLIKEGFDPNKTEHQIMLDRGYYRIYDSGSLVFNYSHQSSP